jgi:hypothetical protein
VVRGTSAFLFLLFDFEHRLAAAHNARDGFRGLCGDVTTVFTPGEFQDILSPADEILVQELFKAEGAFVNVYPWDGVFPPTVEALCDFLHGTRLAQGTARLVNTDNDFFAFLRDAPIRADAFGFTAQGTVNLASGGQAQYNAALRFVFFPPEPGRVVTARIGLTPN